MNEQIRIAIYGKGGIGKSCTASNIAASMADLNLNVVIIGCDPKSDSSISLLGGKRIPTILDFLRAGNKNLSEEDIVFEGYGGVKCIEIGGPEPGVGCAGRGVIVAIQTLNKISTATENADVIIYDVPGDIVCGGFIAPIRKGFVNEIYILTSGEYMPLYAANNICKGLARINTKLSGVICNSRLVDREKEIVEKFADGIGSKLTSFIPKKQMVQDCERDGFTVIEKAPDSDIAEVYKKLALDIISNAKKCIPNALDDEVLRGLTR